MFPLSCIFFNNQISWNLFLYLWKFMLTLKRLQTILTQYREDFSIYFLLYLIVFWKMGFFLSVSRSPLCFNGKKIKENSKILVEKSVKLLSDCLNEKFKKNQCKSGLKKMQKIFIASAILIKSKIKFEKKR